MAYIDVSTWSSENVASWVRGLHSSLEKTSLERIIRFRVNGTRLLLLDTQDLVELVPSIKVEALQLILEGIKLLRYLNYNSTQETLQSLILTLATQARYLQNQLIQEQHSPRILPVTTSIATPMTGNSKNRFDFAKVDSNMQINQSTKQRVSLETLESVSVLVNQIRLIINWLNLTYNPTSMRKFTKDFKTIVLSVAIEITSTAQRDQFVEQPNDVIKKTSKFLADYCEWVVIAIDDSDFIQPCWMDVVSVKKKQDEEDFGIIIQPESLGKLIIEDVVFSSPAHRSGRLSFGDEVVQIEYQTVVGWPLQSVKDLIKTYTGELILTIKKKPSQSTLNPSVVIMKPYAIPLKRVLSHNSESFHLTEQNLDAQENEKAIESQQIVVDQNETALDDANLEPPKEPKGPVYELKKPRRDLKRRVSFSGSASDALADLSLADAIPLSSLVAAFATPIETATGKAEINRITKETLTKSTSHDTAKLYLHTLSIDRKHFWLPPPPEKQDDVQ